MKPEFYIEHYRDTRARTYVMHCETIDEAQIFANYLHSKGRSWRSGTTYLEKDGFDSHKEESCYFFNQGCVDSLSLIKKSKFISRHTYVLSFKDFCWKEQENGIDLTDVDNKNFVDFISPYLEVNNEI